MADDALPPLPPIALSIVRDETAPRDTGGFLNLRRLQLAARYPDGSVSAPFKYDIATRTSLDAVVLLAHYVRDGVRHVFIRSAVRPPCALRDRPPPHDGLLWELPAGLIDGDETPAEAGARELEEELGIRVTPSALRELGPWTFPAPGMCGERHIFLSVEVDPTLRRQPSEDGSALERHACVVAITLDAALDACRRALLPDAKTELALRRFHEFLHEPSHQTGIATS